MGFCAKFCALLVLIPIALILIVPDWRDTATVIYTSFAHGRKARLELEPKYIANERTFKSLSGKNCLVTGSSRGLGKSIVSELMALGCHVYCAQRDVKGMNIIDEVTEAARNISNDGKLIGTAELLDLDLDDLVKVSQTVKKMIERKIELDVLVLNAAIVTSSTQYTKQGFEKMMGVYFVGHFYFVEELLSHNLIKNGTNEFSSRIIWVSSDCHRPARPIDVSKFPNDTIEVSYFTALDQYGYSKLCALTVAHEMGASLLKRHISSLSYDPGPVATEITRGAVPEWMQDYAKQTLALLFNPAADCAMPVGFLASSTQFNDVSDHYRIFWTATPARADTTDPEKSKLVYQKSLEIIRPYRI